MIFQDRTEAGRQLAHQLVQFRDSKPVVLALPRGGVPVAFEIAASLGAPLDLVLVRKIGAPWQPELAIGAVVDADPPETVVRQEMVDALGVSEAYVTDQARKAVAEMERQRRLYVGDRQRPDLTDATAIVVDDGIATGATMQVALGALRRARPRRLVLAVPVAPPDAVRILQPAADVVVCLSMPTDFRAVSLHYTDFRQVTDEQVVDLLARAAGQRGGEWPSVSPPRS